MIDIKKVLYFIKREGLKTTADIFLQRMLLLSRNFFMPKKFVGMPKVINIETTSLCNLNCEYCMLRNNMLDKRTMSLPEFKLLMPYIKYMDHVGLGGMAEPLMNKDIVEFIRCIKKSCICSVAINSNGTLWNEKISSDLINAGLDNVCFSIDSTDEYINNSARKGSELSVVINNINELNNLKKNKTIKKTFLVYMHSAAT